MKHTARGSGTHHLAGVLIILAGMVAGLPAWAEEFRFISDPDIHAALIREIDASQHQISAEIFILTDREIITRLSEAARRGVMVRVILCPTQDENRKPAEWLRQGGSEVRWYPITLEHQIMHLKLAVMDGRLWFGSANWTHYGLRINHEGVMISDNTKIVADIQNRFDADWEHSSENTGFVNNSNTVKKKSACSRHRRSKGTRD
jgi:phosphatidylserine/phosphatidylglycerophosphate/cardiolipin synthase-like enzyme